MNDRSGQRKAHDTKSAPYERDFCCNFSRASSEYYGLVKNIDSSSNNHYCIIIGDLDLCEKSFE